jgi:hypothetical protein
MEFRKMDAAERRALARHAEVGITDFMSGGALVSGGFYDWPPGAKIPRGTTSIDGAIVPILRSKWRDFTGPIFLKGLPGGLPEHARWQGMIEPDGIYQYQTFFGPEHTVPAYVVSAADDPVEAQETAPQAPSRHEMTGTSLDHSAYGQKH